jgi:cell division protein FtsQ
MEHTRNEAVQAMVQPALAGGFLNADLERIRDQLEALPWIYRATVRRRWPNALEIHVEEQLPIARWGEAGFLNHEGEVFRSENGERWSSLPLLQGPEGSASALVATYQRLVNVLRPLDLSVERLAMDDRGQVEATLDHGVVLMLGGGDFLERMQRLVVIHRTELAERFADVERIDLRYASGVAVAFRPDEQVAGVTGK